MLSLATLKDLETQNLILREMRVGDGKDLACYMTQPRYQRFIAQRLSDEAEVKAFVTRQVSVQGESGRKMFHLVAEERYSAEVVGDAFLIARMDRSVEIGWGLHPALWRVGFGTEIGRALLALGFERLRADKLWCKVMRPNVASASLAKRIGMEQADQREHFAVAPGRSEAVDFYQMDAETYFNLPY
ncbi:GNAT family N-acetyltransferase [Aestuariivirga litoralis]|uniref:GNAT family N-acetyltransferase n=1 Tax=Aestuariivirga litoralis TaxID=2650924 RepID=UPI0018C58809|nr:GNAT family N-acetyltransferase [Aestuariivirga litoralis]MBG1231885.1 GNAT family N-acetyltransferase [Aestuariivirga litoralis]